MNILIVAKSESKLSAFHSNTASIASFTQVFNPVSGKIKIKPIAVAGLIGKKTSKTELFIIVRVDGIQRAKSRPARGKWSEDIIFTVDKASEIEINVYEKDGPILSLIWFMISDLCEELDNVNEFYANNLVAPAKNSADVDNASTTAVHVTIPTKGATPPPPSFKIGKNESLESWFDMEPTGQLLMKINFGMTKHQIIVGYTCCHSALLTVFMKCAPSARQGTKAKPIRSSSTPKSRP